MDKMTSASSLLSDNEAQSEAFTGACADSATLPARVVVQNPNGDVTLGEDTARLQHEVADAQKLREAHHAQSMRPGGQRWAQVAYHQYWLSLCVTLQARKRLMLSPIGMLGAM
jgi:hypothetical protein